jgi:hypothetical protein
MSVSMIEGTVIDAELKARRGKVARYSHIVIARADGGTQRLDRQILAAAIADHIVPGAKGRFYRFRTIDLKGIHAIRLADGTALYAFPGNNEPVFVILMIVNLAWIALLATTEARVPFLGVLLLGLGIFGFVATRRSRAETRNQFDADAQGASSPASAPAGAQPVQE